MKPNTNYEMKLPELNALGWGATVEDLKMKVNEIHADMRALSVKKILLREEANKIMAMIEKMEAKQK